MPPSISHNRPSGQALIETQCVFGRPAPGDSTSKTMLGLQCQSLRWQSFEGLSPLNASVCLADHVKARDGELFSIWVVWDDLRKADTHGDEQSNDGSGEMHDEEGR